MAGGSRCGSRGGGEIHQYTNRISFFFYTASITVKNEFRGFTDTQGLTPNKQEWQGKPGF